MCKGSHAISPFTNLNALYAVRKALDRKCLNNSTQRTWHTSFFSSIGQLVRRDRCLPCDFITALTSYTRKLDSQLRVTKYSASTITSRTLAVENVYFHVDCDVSTIEYRYSFPTERFALIWWIKIYSEKKMTLRRTIFIQFPSLLFNKNQVKSNHFLKIFSITCWAAILHEWHAL